MRITCICITETFTKSKSVGKISKINVMSTLSFTQPIFTIRQYHIWQNPRATSGLRRILTFQKGDPLHVALRHFSINDLISASSGLPLTVLVMSFAATKKLVFLLMTTLQIFKGSNCVSSPHSTWVPKLSFTIPDTCLHIHKIYLPASLSQGGAFQVQLVVKNPPVIAGDIMRCGFDP